MREAETGLIIEQLELDIENYMPTINLPNRLCPI